MTDPMHGACANPVRVSQERHRFMFMFYQWSDQMHTLVESHPGLGVQRFASWKPDGSGREHTLPR